MAAVNPRPGTFVLEVAELGKDVLSTFTQFVLSRKVLDHRLESLLANISITTSLLVELGSTINKYQNEYHVKDEITRPTCQTCKEDFGKLIAMSKIAKEKGGWITESPAGGQPIATEVDPWFIFNVTLGQGEKANQFWWRLNQTRLNLDALNDTIKYKVFKALNEQNRLEPKQIEELKNLTTLVPRMVQTLEKTEKERKERLSLEDKKGKKEKGKETPKTVKSSRKRPDVGEKDDFAEFIEKAAEADAMSEDTMVDVDNIPVQDKKKKKQVKFAVDNDHSSVSSFEPHERNFDNDTKVIYEEWLLSYHSPRSVVARSWGFLGLKLKDYDEESEYWKIGPELRSQGELLSAFKNATASMIDAKYRASVDKAIRAFPEDARDLIDWLIQDRLGATNNEHYIRKWSVVAVRPKEKPAFRSGKKLVKSVKGSDWLIMIKGETVAKVERTRPNRYCDPWRKPCPRRYFPRHYDRFGEREYNRHRPHYEEYDEFIPRPPVRVVDERRYAREHDEDGSEDGSEYDSEDDSLNEGFRSDVINVGMFSSREDAEERMDRVLEDMARNEVS